jgi:hypothetical protein
MVLDAGGDLLPLTRECGYGSDFQHLYRLSPQLADGALSDARAQRVCQKWRAATDFADAQIDQLEGDRSTTLGGDGSKG